MIVDDDLDIRDSMQEILEDQGYAVVTACDGADALAQLRGGLRPRLILLDLMMPVMDGFAFCQEWKKDPALSVVPVIVISADAAVTKKAAACGATGFLDKPLNLQTLIEAVERYTARPGTAPP